MIRYFAQHPTAANLLMAAIVILGLMSASTLTRGLFPEFDVPVVQVTTLYPGASVAEVEESICRRIEQQIEGVDGIKRIESLAREDLGLTTVSLTDDVDPSEVRSKIEEELAKLTDLPDLAEKPIVEVMDVQLDVLYVAIAGSVPEKDLHAYAKQLRDELLELEDVSDVTLTGFSDHELRIEVHETALLAHGLSLRDVSQVIRQQSIDLPGGDVDVGGRDIKVRVTDQRRWAEHFRDVTIVSNTTGATIPLRALAEIRDTFDEDWSYATYNGRRGGHLRVGTSSRDDVLDVANRIKRYLSENASRYPSEIEIGVWKDMSIVLQGRWSMLVENVGYGVVLVFLTLWTFLNGRLALWVALGIPISFLGTLRVLELCDMPLDMISMIGLIVAIGLIVDDAIVIAENVFAHRQNGESGLDAAINGTREVAVGVISSMVTTLAIFMPLLLMTGMFGKIMYVIPFSVITALSVSLVEAFLILPKHLSEALPGPGETPHKMRAKIDLFIDFIRDDLYGRTLDWSLNNRAIAFATVLALFIAVCGLIVGGRLRFQPMPEMETRWIAATVVMPEGTSSERTQEVVRQLESAIVDVNKRFSPNEIGRADLIQHVCTFFGSLPQSQRRGSHVAEVWIEMIDTEFRVAELADVVSYWTDKVGDVADAEQLTFEQPVLGPALRAIQIALQGDDLDSLNQASQKLQQRLAQFSGVKNIQTDLKPGKEEFRVRLKESANALGISASSLAQQLRAAFFGEHVQQFQRGNEVVDVSVMLHPADRSSQADIEYFQVLTPAGVHVPLYEIAHADTVRGYSSMSRLDGGPVVNVSADVDSAMGNSMAILADLDKSYFAKLIHEYPGISIRIRGEAEESNETLASMFQGFIIGSVAIFIVLSFAFRSYIEPFIVLLAVPLGFMGAIVGHLLLGITLSIMSIVGLISLAGILVNDTIVMVEFIKLRLAEGLEPQNAFSRAGRERFRAVVLTTATTTMGLLPMILETSAQAVVFKGLIVSILFGELFSTAMILVLVPCSYSVLNDFGLVSRRSNAEPQQLS